MDKIELLSMNHELRKTVKFFKKNYFLAIFFAAILFVGVIAGYRLFLTKPNFVYVKVKVGQGLWWAATQRPSIWQVDAINKGDIAYGLIGGQEAKILSKKHYRWYGFDQYDIYLTMLLRVGFNKRTGEYAFNRSVISVGSPIEVQFPKAQITGTVIALSQKPFEEKLVKKTIILNKKYAHPWEFDAIKIGDSYFDGENKIFEVVDKQSQPPSGELTFFPGAGTSAITEPANYIEVTAKVKLKQVNNQWILGEDQLIVPGGGISISTPNFVFDNYIVSRIE